MTKIARADVIGSLLRPPYLQEARKAAREGRLGAGEARAAEDRAITEAITLQEAAGMDAVTDGEFRRMSFIATIGVRDAELGPLTGFKTLVTDAEWTGLWKNPDGSFGGLTLPEDRTKARRSIVVDKVGVKRDIVAEEFPFLKAHTRKAQAKYTFPAPSWHRVAWDPKHSRDAYPTAREFLLAMRDYIRDVVKKLIAGRLHLHPHGRAQLRPVAHRPEDQGGVRVLGARHGQGADRGRRDRQLRVRRHQRSNACDPSLSR